MQQDETDDNEVYTTEEMLMINVVENNLNEIKHYLNSGFDPNCISDGVTALWIAAQEGNFEIAVLLIDAGADINFKHSCGQSVLWTAAEKGHSQIVRLLLNKGALKNEMAHQISPLWIAANNNHDSTVQELINAKCDVNLPHQLCKRTPIFTTSLNANYTLTTELINAKADINLSDIEGKTPLHASASIGALNIVKALLLAGADTNQCDNQDQTALDFALKNNHPEVVNILIDITKPDISARNIVNQVNKYIEIKKSGIISIEEDTVFKQFNEVCSKGYCAGGTRLWVALKPLKIWPLFQKKLEQIAQWTPGINNFNDADFLKIISILLKWQKKHTLGFKTISDDIKTIEQCVGSEIVPSNDQTLSFGFIFTLSQLQNFICQTISSTNFITITKASALEEGHVIGLSINDEGRYHLFNTNFRHGEKSFNCITDVVKALETPLEYEKSEQRSLILNVFDDKTLNNEQYYLAIKNKIIDVILSDKLRSNTLDLANPEWHNLLNSIVRAGDEQTLKRVLNYNLINEKTAINEALFLASANDDFYDCTKLLIQRGADVNSTKLNNSPVCMAVDNNSEKNLCFLIKNKASLDFCDSTQNTLLMRAVAQENIGIVRTLLSKKVDVDATNNLNVTASYIAILKKNLEITELLLQAGANPLIKIANYSLYEHAYVAGCTEIAKLLKKYEKKTIKVKVNLSSSSKFPLFSNEEKENKEYLGSPLEEAPRWS